MIDVLTVTRPAAHLYLEPGTDHVVARRDDQKPPRGHVLAAIAWRGPYRWHLLNTALGAVDGRRAEHLTAFARQFLTAELCTHRTHVLAAHDAPTVTALTVQQTADSDQAAMFTDLAAHDIATIRARTKSLETALAALAHRVELAGRSSFTVVAPKAAHEHITRTVEHLTFGLVTARPISPQLVVRDPDMLRGRDHLLAVVGDGTGYGTGTGTRMWVRSALEHASVGYVTVTRGPGVIAGPDVRPGLHF